MLGTTLVHIGIAATDLERSVAFWRDALGLRVVGTMKDCYDLSDGYHNYRLFQHRGPERPPHVTGLLAYLHLGVKVDDLAAAIQRLETRGHPIVCDGVDEPKPYDPTNPPTESFKVEDPDGIVLDVTARTNQWPGVGLGD
ncbi:MAG TPA: VOC family protein [Thermomicrobiales bacterium]|nr:VOC family protein [Thermomicrobiales bacterium]